MATVEKMTAVLRGSKVALFYGNHSPVALLDAFSDPYVTDVPQDLRNFPVAVDTRVVFT